jgi:hypothetical protein
MEKSLRFLMEVLEFCEAYKLLILERETGLEPATSSLGTYAAIGNREHMRPRR